MLMWTSIESSSKGTNWRGTGHLSVCEDHIPRLGLATEKGHFAHGVLKTLDLHRL